MRMSCDAAVDVTVGVSSLNQSVRLAPTGTCTQSPPKANTAAVQACSASAMRSSAPKSPAAGSAPLMSIESTYWSSACAAPMRHGLGAPTVEARTQYVSFTFPVLVTTTEVVMSTEAFMLTRPGTEMVCVVSSTPSCTGMSVETAPAK
jgi:hypothetical protein